MRARQVGDRTDKRPPASYAYFTGGPCIPSINIKMRVRPSKQAQECYVNATRCRCSALAASDRATRDAFLVMEQRWLNLARCYDTPKNRGMGAIPGLSDPARAGGGLQ